MKKYIAYYRVSTKKQGESGLGLDAQKAIVRHFAKDDDVLAEYLEVRSGGSLDGRVELRSAVDHAKRENAVLIVAKADRLSRNVVDALNIYEEIEQRLMCCDIPHTDKFALTIIFAVAERERELIKIRTKEALKAKRKRDGKEIINGSPFHKPRKLVILNRDDKKLAYIVKEESPPEDFEKEGRFLGEFIDDKACNDAYLKYLEERKSKAGVESAKLRKASTSLKQRNLILISKQLREKGESLGKIAITLASYGYKTEQKKDITATHVFRMLKRG